MRTFISIAAVCFVVAVLVVIDAQKSPVPKSRQPMGAKATAWDFPKVQDEYTAKVVRIIDGDTVEVLRDKKTIKIRLEGIDCPESKQPWGTVAKQFAGSKLHNETVNVFETNVDFFGRTVAYLVADGRCVNYDLAAEGLAWHYKKYSKDQKIADLELKARESKTGLWSAPEPVAPWDFRRAK